MKFVDVHCHCLPNLDDGPESLDEALALCAALAEDNVDVVIATPHQLGRFETRTNAQRVRDTVWRLNHELSRQGLDLTVLGGAEVQLDERIGELLADDEILTLADRRRHILVELPGDTFIDIEPLRAQLAREGVDVIVAHPERNAPLLRHPGTLQQWLDCGVSLQVTAASLTGGFGPVIGRIAWRLVAEGTVAVIATDAHDCDINGPYMTAAYEMTTRGLGREMADLLCVKNPSRILQGERIVPAFSWIRQEVR